MCAWLNVTNVTAQRENRGPSRLSVCRHCDLLQVANNNASEDGFKRKALLLVIDEQAMVLGRDDLKVRKRQT